MEGLEEKLKGLSLARRSLPEEPTYLLDVALQPAGLLAVACSNFTIHLHNKDTLSLVGQYQGHSGPLCGVVFSHNSPDSLYSGSADGTVRGWDVRRPGSEAVQVFKSGPSHNYCSFDLNCSDTLLCAGTEQVNDEDSFLVFWDVRKPGGKLLGVYSESHSDDITQVILAYNSKQLFTSGQQRTHLSMVFLSYEIGICESVYEA
ncbi:WD repeat-containing protein 89 [Dissostichus eleginoides]|uniref:WD repeat-containing protein 89 n=1 Tax=Dissostichus eleginoides TaxID=100907 RepID=A0AAD9F5N5_DISEL|nr:WD repeat-containing protein 89 [Dissostichus eleginoides]